jgi:hypothetical protein
MNSLSKEEKDIILDFYFRCGSTERINQARDLIASDPRAAKLYASLEDSLQSLDSIKYEPCPDNLAELTVARLKLAASSEQARLESLLAEEQRRSQQSNISGVTTKRSFWRNIAEVAAVAAVFLVVIGVYFPATSSMRQIAWRNRCNTNMASVSAGLGAFASDHNGSLPAVDMNPGSPWWKVGNQGKENQSNTRHIWLLAKDGYVDLESFICPGREDSQTQKFDTAKASSLSDFPNRKAMSYSFKFMANNTAKKNVGSKTVLLSDLNPVFENRFSDNAVWSNSDNFTRILIDEQLRTAMSSNHGSKGQNVLLGDGSSNFQKSRVMFDDDIFTVKGKSVYSGCEVPSDNQDIFLAP